MTVLDVLAVWLGNTVSRVHGWWLHRNDKRLPAGFWGEETS